MKAASDKTAAKKKAAENEATRKAARKAAAAKKAASKKAAAEKIRAKGARQAAKKAAAEKAARADAARVEAAEKALAEATAAEKAASEAAKTMAAAVEAARVQAATAEATLALAAAAKARVEKAKFGLTSTNSSNSGPPVTAPAPISSSGLEVLLFTATPSPDPPFAPLSSPVRGDGGVAHTGLSGAAFEFGCPSTPTSSTEVVDLSSDEPITERFLELSSPFSYPIMSVPRRDCRPTRTTSVTSDLRVKHTLEQELATDELVLGLATERSSAANNNSLPPSTKPRPKGARSVSPPPSSSSVTGVPLSGVASRSTRRQSQPKQAVVTATLSTTPGSDSASFTPAADPLAAWCQICNQGLPPPLPKPLEAPCSVAGIKAFAVSLNPSHPFQQLRQKFPDEPCTFDLGEYGDDVKISKADLGLGLYERRHWVQGAAVENYLRRLAKEVGMDHPRYVAILKAWREYNKTRNALVDRLRWQMPPKVWEWCIETGHEPRRCPAERLLEPTYLQCSFEIIEWVPTTDGWMTEVAKLDQLQPWRNCWVDAPFEHPYNTAYTPCNADVPLFVPRGMTAGEVVSSLIPHSDAKTSLPPGCLGLRTWYDPTWLVERGATSAMPNAALSLLPTLVFLRSPIFRDLAHAPFGVLVDTAAAIGIDAIGTDALSSSEAVEL
ncbi:hypothetical protein PHMEG_00024973 [Phytophthora megakarya]|uniref:Uncharacterized protein n=1 Tax=Phytophthora megakarya TaxID=4795 RepID=A0A225VFP0_9STRA|nr:hypothetical protein PHMEG_00024973 [Phytophthora megakarya]